MDTAALYVHPSELVAFLSLGGAVILKVSIHHHKAPM